MGYTLTIGNAKVTSGIDYGEMWARWEVEGATHPDAPVFPHDAMTGNSNQRSPSYTAWRDLAGGTGLVKLFYGGDGEDGLLANHPGCAPLTEAHHAEVLAALQRRQARATKPPGFGGEGTFSHETRQWVPHPDTGRYDANLARLLWLAWWMRWALDNCETPAFQNR